MAKETEEIMVELYQQMMERREAQFEYKQLAADIRRKKDDYSLIEHDYYGVVDINQPSTVPFRWEEEDVGKEMVIVDPLGQFGDQRIIELTLTCCDDETIEFQIDKLTLIDISPRSLIRMSSNQVASYGLNVERSSPVNNLDR